MNRAFARLIEDARPDRRDNRPLVMEPEDEIRALREEVARLRKALLNVSAEITRAKVHEDGGHPYGWTYFLQKDIAVALNPAKSA